MDFVFTVCDRAAAEVCWQGHGLFPYLSETASGLTYAVDRFKEWEYSGHVILLRGERSRLADFAAEAL